MKQYLIIFINALSQEYIGITIEQYVCGHFKEMNNLETRYLTQV